MVRGGVINIWLLKPFESVTIIKDYTNKMDSTRLRFVRFLPFVIDPNFMNPFFPSSRIQQKKQDHQAGGDQNSCTIIFLPTENNPL